MSESILSKRMSRIRDAERLRKMAEEPVVVNSLHQLKEAILSFLPKKQDEITTIKTDTKGIIADRGEKIPINGTLSAEVHVPNMNRLLVQGLELAEKRSEITESVDLEDDAFGGFTPATSPRADANYLWVDTLIKYRLDGKRRDNLVYWELEEGTFVFNPRTGELMREA